MPRKPRVFVNGAIYHVYCRTAHGEAAFGERDEVKHLLQVLREVRDRDDLSVLAWCIMSNHYHLAVRTGRVPLWRSMRLIQGRSSVGYCKRKRLPGPLWQGRYKAKVIADQGYLSQVIAYIHLNPVAAEIVRDPAAYRWSGHCELIGRRRSELASVSDALSLYGDTVDGARLGYLSSLRGPRGEGWVRELPGRLPWWPQREPGNVPVRPKARSTLDALGASTAPAPGQLPAGEFAAGALAVLGLERDDVEGRRKRKGKSRAREALILVGVEQYGVRVRELAELLDLHPGSVSRALERAALRRRQDATFAEACLDLETRVKTRQRSTELQLRTVS